MNCSDDNRCFGTGIHAVISGVLENFTVALATQTQKLCCIMSEINDCNNPPLMIIQTRDCQGREAPPFMAGSSHLIKIYILEGFCLFRLKTFIL